MMDFMFKILIYIEINCSFIPLRVDLLFKLAIFRNQDIQCMGLMLSFSFLFFSFLDYFGNFLFFSIYCLTCAHIRFQIVK